MKTFFFSGRIPASKSLLNRWRLIAEFSTQLHIDGESQCLDAQLCQAGLVALKEGRPIHCGDAGTVLRFLAFRASRVPGEHRLVGSERLLSRPHQDLQSILSQLGVKISWQRDGVVVQSRGWQKPMQPVLVNPSQTSQFLSGLLLASWDLDFDLPIEWHEAMVSEAYLEMTKQVVRQAGMEIDESERQIVIPRGQKVNLSYASVEPDLSSAFAVAAIAAVAGEACFESFPQNSLQPDFRFVEILRQMNVPLEQKASRLVVRQASELSAVDVDLGNCPDLFPVLSVLCAGVRGSSKLRGAPHLKFKESDRIAKTSELLKLLEVPHQVYPDGLQIEGGRTNFSRVHSSFGPDHDHRLAMAAQLANWMGSAIQIEEPNVVNKSFPEFWQIAGSVP